MVRTNYQKPPTVPYAVPWVGSAITLGKDPDLFFDKAIEQFGEIFGVQVAGRKMYYVTSAPLISSVYKDHKNLVFDPIRVEYSIATFGMSPKAANSPTLSSELFNIHSRLVAPQTSQPMLESFTGYIYKYISELRASLTEDVTEFNLMDMISPTMFMASSDMMMGPTFPAEKAFKPFFEFDKAFPLIVAGLPRIFLRNAFKARDQVIGMFETYLQGPWRGTCAETIESIESIARSDGWKDRDTASVLMSTYWVLQANASRSAFWIIALMLSQGGGLASLTKEFDSARKEWLRHNPTRAPFGTYVHQFISDSNLPLLSSAITETIRYSSSSFSIRRVGPDGAIIGGYEFVKDDLVICATRCVHIDPEIYDDPRTFKPERFMDATAKFTKKGQNVPNAFMGFGGGVSKCEGRYIATHAMRVFVAIFLASFTVELNPAKPCKMEPDRSRIGTGTMPPKGSLHVLVRKRTDVY